MYVSKAWIFPAVLSGLLLVALGWTVATGSQALETTQTSSAPAQTAQPVKVAPALSAKAVQKMNKRALQATLSGMLNYEELEAIVCNQGAVSTAGGTAGGANGGGSTSGGSNGSSESEDNQELTAEYGNYASNSGSLADSFFLDGGTGDVSIINYKSVLTGVNFGTNHLSGNKSQISDSGNGSNSDVRDNENTANNEPNIAPLNSTNQISTSGDNTSNNDQGLASESVPVGSEGQTSSGNQVTSGSSSPGQSVSGSSASVTSQSSNADSDEKED